MHSRRLDMPAELAVRLGAVADALGMSDAAFIRSAVEAECQRHMANDALLAQLVQRRLTDR